MTKNIMSIAAAAAILTSGASAFETDINGTIKTVTGQLGLFVDGNYTSIKATGPAVMEWESAFAHGDALLYPAFDQNDGFGTEFTVRNDRDVAIVAKVAVYAIDDSHELIDFTVVLSPYDVFRFTIENGKITSTDDSVVTVINDPLPQTSRIAEIASVKTAAEVPMSVELPEKAGYVIVYGMMESDTVGAYHDTSATDDSGHAKLFGDYRAALDAMRPGWRNAYQVNGTMAGGTYMDGVNSPNMDANTSIPFVDVNETSLTGTVRIFNHGNDDNGARDMILNATPIKNFTDGGAIVMWSEGEIANLEDRWILGTVGDMAAYDKTGVELDAANLLVAGGYYTFNNAGTTASLQNKMIMTQPFKRTLVQLGNTDGYWVGPVVDNSQLWTGLDHTLVIGCEFHDEFEQSPADPQGGSGMITSPFDSSTEIPDTEKDEVIVLTNLEDNEQLADEGYDAKNGYAQCRFGEFGIPGVSTQMIGTEVNGQAMMNWLYTVRP